MLNLGTKKTNLGQNSIINSAKVGDKWYVVTNNPTVISQLTAVRPPVKTDLDDGDVKEFFGNESWFGGTSFYDAGAFDDNATIFEVTDFRDAYDQSMSKLLEDKKVKLSPKSNVTTPVVKKSTNTSTGSSSLSEFLKNRKKSK